MIKIKPGASGRITVGFPYKPDYITKIKIIKGHRWHPEEKHWSFPYSDTVIAEILSVFAGEEVDIDPSLQAMKSLNQKGRMENNIKVVKKSLPTEVIKEKEERNLGRDFEDLRRELTFRKYSPKTIKAYIHSNEDLLQLLKKSSQEITNEDIKGLGKIRSPLDNLTLEGGDINKI